jgi:hypothetical protein
MSKNIARADGPFKQAVGFLKKYTNMTISDAMKLADFLFRNKHVTQSAWSFIASGRSKKATRMMFIVKPHTRQVQWSLTFSTKKGTPSPVTDETAKVAAVSQEPPMPRSQEGEETPAPTANKRGEST